MFASQNSTLIRLPDFEDRAFLSLHCLYPNAAETLRQQLVDTMTDRYARLQYEAYRTGNAQMPKQGPENPLTPETNGDAAEKDAQVGTAGTTKDDPTDMDQKDKQRQVVNLPASTIDTARLPANLEHAIAPSIRQSKAPKTLTGHNGRPREPDLPRFKEGEDHTTCEWCHQVVDRTLLQRRFNGHLEWSDEGRRHYRRDLQPYSCLALDCSEARPTFASSRDWFMHMKTSHTKHWSVEIHNQLS